MSKPGDPVQTNSIAQRLAGLRPQEAAQPQPTIYLAVERGPDIGRSYAVDGAGAVSAVSGVLAGVASFVAAAGRGPRSCWNHK